MINLDAQAHNADWLRQDLADMGIRTPDDLRDWLDLHQMSLEHFMQLPVARRNAHALAMMVEAPGRDMVKGVGSVWRTILHPRDRFGRFRESSIGVTPFRDDEDKPRGFYNSPKFGDFTEDTYEFAREEGIRVVGADHRTGLWKGGSEPSVDLRIVARSPRAARRYAARLGKKYNQDAVATFRMNKKGKSALYTVKGRFTQEQAWQAAQDAGLEFGRMAPGRFEFIGGGDEAEKVYTMSAAVGGTVSFVPGDAELIERSEYDDAARKAVGDGLQGGRDAARRGRDGRDARLQEGGRSGKAAGEAGEGSLAAAPISLGGMEIVAQDEERYVIALDDNEGFILDMSTDPATVSERMSPDQVEPLARWVEPLLGEDEESEVLARAKLLSPRKP